MIKDIVTHWLRALEARDHLDPYTVTTRANIDGHLIIVGTETLERAS